jgi:hypothetical protein
MKYAKQYFDNHGTVDMLYFTSDQLAFFDEQNAINHAKQLDDKTITSMLREEVEEELDELSNGQLDEETEYDPLDIPDGE